MGLDIKLFHLNTNLDCHKHVWAPENMLTNNMKKSYKLDDLIHNGRVLVEIRKGMHGSLQLGMLAHEKLMKHLATCRHSPCDRTPGPWQHKTRHFAEKCQRKQDAGHLLHATGKLCDFTTDWELRSCCGITLKWDCDERSVMLSMPGCVKMNSTHASTHNHTDQNMPHTDGHRQSMEPNNRIAWKKTHENFSKKMVKNASNRLLDCSNVALKPSISPC